MSPFLEFRLWLREGPAAERAATGAVAAVIVVLAAAAFVPVGEDSTDTGSDSVVGEGPVGSSTGAGPQTSPGTGTTGTGPALPGSTGGGGTSSGSTGAAVGTTGGTATSTTGTTGVVGSTGGATDCRTQRTASAPGVTATEVRLDMANVSLAGPVGNSTFKVRPDLAQIANALAADVNAKGGVACGRRLVLKQYDVNPLDSNDSQAKCLEMRADRPFLVVNFGAYLTPAARQCLVQGRVLQVAGTQADQRELTASYPYLVTPAAVAEQMVDATLFGLARRGFFKAPKFQKLGLFEDRCSPPVNRRIQDNLAKIGIKPSQISTYMLDCQISAPPNQIEQGVLQHKMDGATHVFLAASQTNDQNYVRIARSHLFEPQYLISDYGANTSGAGASNWGVPFEGAVAVTTTRVGELSSGIRNPQMVACDRALRTRGVRGVQTEEEDSSALSYCDVFGLLRQALDRAGVNPTQRSFVHALSTMGLYRTAQAGDGLFNRQGKITGGDFERQAVYRSSCGCWRVVDRTMRPYARTP